MVYLEEKSRFSWKRAGICAVGMFLYASGVALTKNCDLGISPIVSVAYSLSLVTGITLGWCTSLFNLFLFLLQRLLLKKEYTLRTAAGQFIMSICFSIFIDLAGLIWSWLCPAAYGIRLIQFVLGCVVLAWGMNLVLLAEFVILPAEGAVMALARGTKQPFSRTKIGFDGAMVLLTCGISLCFLGRIEGVREGTVLAVILIGACSKPIRKMLYCIKRPE